MLKWKNPGMSSQKIWVQSQQFYLRWATSLTQQAPNSHSLILKMHLLGVLGGLNDSVYTKANPVKLNIIYYYHWKGHQGHWPCLFYKEL